MNQWAKTTGIPLTLLVFLGLIWGSGYSIAKYATMNGVSPLGYAYWQSLGPAVLMCLILFSRKESLPKDKKHIRFYGICGLLGIAIPNTNMYLIAPHLPAGILAVIVNTVPIITYPLALLLQQENFSQKRFWGVFAGFVGIIIMIGLPSNTLSLWTLLALISPLSFSLCALYINRYRPQNLSSLTLSAGMLIASSLLLSPLIFLTKSFYPLMLPFSLPDWIVVLEILLSTLGYVIFFLLLKKAGPVYYSLVGGIVSITGLFWGGIIFHEGLSIRNALAVGLIFLALFWVSPLVEEQKSPCAS